MTIIRDNIAYSFDQAQKIFEYFNVECKKKKEYFSENEVSDILMENGVDYKETPSAMRAEYKYSIKDLADALDCGITYRELLNDEKISGLLYLFEQNRPKVLKLYTLMAHMFTEEQKNSFVKQAAFYRVDRVKNQVLHDIQPMAFV